MSIKCQNDFARVVVGFRKNVYIYIIAYDSYDANKHQVFILKTHRQRLCFQCAVVNVAAFSAVMHASVRGPPFHCQKADESAGWALSREAIQVISCELSIGEFIFLKQKLMISSKLPLISMWLRNSSIYRAVLFLVSGCVGGNWFNCLWCAKWKCNFQWGKKIKMR